MSRNAAAQGRPDANHAEVVGWYEELYCSVVDTHGQGFGFPDLVVGVAGITELVEVKTEAGQLEPSQIRFQRDWRGSKVRVVRTRADVILHVQTIRERVSRGLR
jgi:hypothetical protein